MNELLTLSADSRSTAGVLLLTIVAIEFGGWFMLKIITGKQPATDFQTAFYRAGHAHAGVLVTLALVGTILVDATNVTGLQAVAARNGIPLAAILMSAGFFLSASKPGATRPNPLIILVYLGMASLAIGAVALGLGLLAS